MRQRLRFGDAVSWGRVVLRGAMHASYSVVRPSFGPHCVCCNAGTTRAVAYHLGAPVRVASPAVPVCVACVDHVRARTGLSRTTTAFVAAGALLFAAAMETSWSAPLLEGAVAVWAAGIIVARAMAKRRRVRAPAGHHRFEMAVLLGATIVDTDNDVLVEDLLARNSTAVRLPTPPLWRLRGEGVPKATATLVKRD
jgi:hypothetical protein